jgi:hypothetical protein
MLHVLSVTKRWSHHRLVPTGIATVLSLTHFYCVLWSSPTSYPLLNYMTCILESFLALAILLTISLNALTQILLEGTITRPLFGHASTLAPKWDEDFSMVLIRIGIASLEATSLAGLGNEVGGVAVSTALNSTEPHTAYGTIEMNRTGVVSISPTIERRGRHAKVQNGFANEIKNIKTDLGERELWWNKPWYKGLARFAVVLWKCAGGLLRLSWRALRRKPYRLLGPPYSAGLPANDREVVKQEGVPDEDELYARFVRRADISDDDDDEFEPPRSKSVSRTPSPRADVFDDESDSASVTEGSDNETVALYADLSSAASTSVSAPFLLAHLTDSTASPLTRSRYRQLLTAPAVAQAAGSASDGWSGSARRIRLEPGEIFMSGLVQAVRAQYS